MGKLFNTCNAGTDTDYSVKIEFRKQGIVDRTSQLFQILGVNIRSNLFNKGNIALIYIYDKILTLIGEEILNNIKYGNLDASDEEIIKAAKLANADVFIKHLSQGYDTVISGNAEILSEGEKQLIAIARAAVADPPVLILDEATSSIDTRTEHLVQDGMDSLMYGRTTFVIAHRLTTIQNAQNILVLTEDGIAESGSHEELLAKGGIYEKLYHMHR